MAGVDFMSRESVEIGTGNDEPASLAKPPLPAVFPLLFPRPVSAGSRSRQDGIAGSLITEPLRHRGRRKVVGVTDHDVSPEEVKDLLR